VDLVTSNDDIIEDLPGRIRVNALGQFVHDIRNGTVLVFVFFL
jgi:hypothetical protein